jgi:hypothetical protein
LHCQIGGQVNVRDVLELTRVVLWNFSGRLIGVRISVEISTAANIFDIALDRGGSVNVSPARLELTGPNPPLPFMPLNKPRS